MIITIISTLMPQTFQNYQDDNDKECEGRLCQETGGQGRCSADGWSEHASLPPATLCRSFTATHYFNTGQKHFHCCCAVHCHYFKQVRSPSTAVLKCFALFRAAVSTRSISDTNSDQLHLCHTTLCCNKCMSFHCSIEIYSV